MYTSVDFTSQIVGRRGSLVPQTRGSHTPFWCGLAMNIQPKYILEDLRRDEIQAMVDSQRKQIKRCRTYMTTISILRYKY
jgi:hypothetical protein